MLPSRPSAIPTGLLSGASVVVPPSPHGGDGRPSGQRLGPPATVVMTPLGSILRTPNTPRWWAMYRLPSGPKAIPDGQTPDCVAGTPSRTLQLPVPATVPTVQFS